MEFFPWRTIAAHKRKYMNIINDKSVGTKLVSAIVIGSLFNGTLLNAGESASENISRGLERRLAMQ
jgi:hypothetical protein